jgi:hypothetical protein
MEAQYTKGELEVLTAVTLDGTKIPTVNTFIDRVIPDSILHKYDPKDVLEVACDAGFMIVQCCNSDRYKANGVWVKPDERLKDKLLRHNKNYSDTFCPPCESRFRARWSKYFKK